MAYYLIEKKVQEFIEKKKEFTVADVAKELPDVEVVHIRKVLSNYLIEGLIRTGNHGYIGAVKIRL